MAEETDHDILIELRVGMKYLTQKLDMHLKRHDVWNYACIGAVLTLATGLIIAVVT